MACIICPHNCKADRITKTGFCGAGENPVVAKTLIHMWEEPPISGTKGSGAVFFAGCNLRCVFCQNSKISRDITGEEVTADRLTEIFFKLASLGVHNINLVTPAHYSNKIASAIEKAKTNGFSLPFVYNTNAYESVEALKQLDGLIDIYLPDIKYKDNEAARRYSNVENYFDTASQAVLEMNRQVGALIMDDDSIARRGLIIRHLVLPGLRLDSMNIVDWIAAHIPTAHVSLMSQYIPAGLAGKYPEINRRITTFEYDSVVEHFFKRGLKNGFIQERACAVGDYVPEF